MGFKGAGSGLLEGNGGGRLRESGQDNETVQNQDF